ncbi:MAG: hypothetical protein J0M24_23855 [Verrucomicrobia bacterium]|nr:hypothetical protein [Verrucomicrobiota bacterium]
MNRRAFFNLFLVGALFFTARADDLIIREAGFNEAGQFFVRFVTHDQYYYVLRRGSLVAKLVNPKDLALPNGSELMLVDDETDPELAFYRVEAIFVSAPADVDNDGIDDLYELLHATILDPLNPLDALLDPDGDGINNLTAYRRNFGYSDAPGRTLSREVSTFNFGEPIHTLEAFSPEVSVYNGLVISPSELLRVVSREISAFNFGSPPLGNVNAISREVSVYRGAVISDSDQLRLVSREQSLFNFGSPIRSVEAYSQELSVFNFGQPVHSLEAISREVSVLNFEESE